MSEKEKFIVTYEDPDHIWPAFYEEYKQRLPIGPISSPANSASNGSPQLTSYTSIPRADFEFHPFPVATSKDVLSMHRLPFMNLFLTVVEDVDMYKAKIRPRIVHWIETVQARKHQQAIIVLVSTGVSTGGPVVPKATTMFAQKPTTLKDRVATDFKSTNARTVQIRLGNSSLWTDFHEAINDCFYAGFGHLVFQLEDDIRRLEAQRQLPGWNFCIFFVTKESLALLLMMVGLYEDALKQYDQLEATFTEVITYSETLPDRASFPDTKRTIQSYRDTGIREKIYQNSCSLCEFSCYLFAQQIHLLEAIGKYSDILSRGRKFISQYCYSDCKQENFCWDSRSKWSYQVAMNLILSSRDTQGDQFDFHLAELFLLARRHLDHFASSALPAFGRKNSLSILPATSAEPSECNLEDAGSIEAVIGDPEAFERVYRHLTQKMTSVYSAQHLERKEAMALYDYALIHLMYGRYQVALEVLLKLSKRKTDWIDIEFGIGKALAKCYKGLKEDEKYLQACTDLVNRYSRSRPKETSKIIQDIVGFACSHVKEIAIGPQVFTVTIVPTSSTSELCLELDNPLSSFAVGEFKAQLLLGSAEIVFSSKDTRELSSGKTLIKLKCEEVLEENTYLLSSFSMRLPSNLTLQTDLLLGQVSSKHKIGLKNDSRLQLSTSMTQNPKASGLVIALESRISIEGSISISIDLGNFGMEPDRISVNGEEVEFDLDDKKLSLNIPGISEGKTEMFFNGLSAESETLEFRFSVNCSEFKFTKFLLVNQIQFTSIAQTATLKNGSVYRAIQATPKVPAQLCYYITEDQEGNCIKVEKNPTGCQQTFYITIKHESDTLMKRVVFCFKTEDSEVFASAQLMAAASSSLFSELESYSLHLHQTYKMSLHFKSNAVDSKCRYSLGIDNGDWMVIGKAGGFIDSASNPLTVQIIPLRCGNLPMPWLSVDSPASSVSIPSNGTFVSVVE